MSADTVRRPEERRAETRGPAGWYEEMLSAITAVQAYMVGEFRARPLFEGLLEGLLKMSRSEYGFIGEVLRDPAGKPFLRTHAVTNIAWDDETRRFYEENYRQGLEFRNLDTLFGRVLTSQEPIISNAPASDPRRGGLPPGHPALHCFLGFPLRAGGAMVGMAGMANRPGGYDQELIESLDPLLQTSANAIFALRAEIERKSAELALRSERSRIHAMLDGVLEGIVTVDHRGTIESVNAAAARMFGHDTEQMVGANVAMLVPEPFRAEHDGLVRGFVNDGEPNILGLDRALHGCRSDGSLFPISLRIVEVRSEDRRLFTGIVRDLSAEERTEEEVRRLRAEVKRSQYGQMVGHSAVMRRVFETIELVAGGDWPVLIEGETGSGKELVARAIHGASARRQMPFIATNTAGLSDELAASQLFGHRRGAFTGATQDQKGFFESAEGGTLFLDEIGDVSPIVQIALLRAIEEREILRLGDAVPRKVDVRVICATNRPLRERVAGGDFRADLLYRLQVAHVQVPPLRARRGDIPLLVETFIAASRASTGRACEGVGPEAMEALCAWAWPGNVRELRNVVDHLSIHCSGRVARLEDLPPELRGDPFSVAASRGTSTHARRAIPERNPVAERERVLAALRRNEGNRSRAAIDLGISRATLYRRLKEIGRS